MNNPLPRHSLTDLVAEALSERLVAGALQPGDRLAEAQLAEELQVSRTPVREALARLTTLGLLEKDTHRGARVAEPTLAELCQVYEVRESLEGLAAGLFALRATDAAREELEATRRQVEAARQAGDAAGVRWHDFLLHRQLIRGGQNEYLAGAGHAEALMLLAYLVRRPKQEAGVRQAVSDPHVEVMRAIEARDGEAAEKAMRAHVRGTRDSLAQALEPEERDRLYPPPGKRSGPRSWVKLR